MHTKLVDGLAKRGVAKLPEGCELVVGLPAAKARLGASRIREIQATSPWNKRVRRSDWAPYCVPDGSQHIVTCPDPAALPKSGWMTEPAIDAALDHVAYIAKHGRPWQSPPVVYDVQDFDEPKSGIVGIDIEGQQGVVDRVGIATKDQVLTCQWDQRSAHLVQELARNPKIELVAHNAPFDSCGLEAELGIRLRPLCTMVATRLVNPWRRIGLGHCAPLYVPGLTPWKHLEATDAEAYNAMDAAVLVPIYERLRGIIADRHLERAYAEDLVAEYAAFAWSETTGDRLQHSVNWVETPVTRAAGIIESKQQGTIDGSGFQHWVWAFCVAEDIVDCKLESDYHGLHKESWKFDVQLRHVLGYGPRQIRNGGEEFPSGVEGLPEDCRDKCIKEITASFDKANPAFVKWRERLARQSRKDGFVTALDGRRFYGGRGGQLQRFVIFAEIGRRLKRTLPYGPRYINHEVVVADKADDRILEALRG